MGFLGITRSLGGTELAGKFAARLIQAHSLGAQGSRKGQQASRPAAENSRASRISKMITTIILAPGPQLCGPHLLSDHGNGCSLSSAG